MQNRFLERLFEASLDGHKHEYSVAVLGAASLKYCCIHGILELGSSCCPVWEDFVPFLTFKKCMLLIYFHIFR